MAARALTAAGRRLAGQSQARPTPLLASSRSGANSHTSASAQREEERRDAHGPAAAMTGAQVEAALNRKNVEVLQGEEHVATVLPDETIGIGIGGDVSAHPARPHLYGGATPGGSTASVLDQAVFVREEDMEDVERPAMDLTDANGGSNNE